MSNTYEQVLAGLKKEGSVRKIESTFPPTLRISVKGGEGVGNFVSGILKVRKTVIINTKEQPVYNIILIATNAKAVRKDVDKKWVDAEVNEGDLVSFFAPTRLDRALRDIGSGVKVLIHYDGMKPMKTPHGMKDTHQFTVHSGNQVDAPVVEEKINTAKEATSTPDTDPFA